MWDLLFSDKVLQRFRLQRNVPLEVAKRDVRLAAALLEVDPESGRTNSIQGMLVPLDPST